MKENYKFFRITNKQRSTEDIGLDFLRLKKMSEEMSKDKLLFNSETSYKMKLFALALDKGILKLNKYEFNELTNCILKHIDDFFEDIDELRKNPKIKKFEEKYKTILTQKNYSKEREI